MEGLESLKIIFTEDEIKRVVWDLGTLKPHGPDGFLLLFYKMIWEETRCDLVQILEDVMNRSTRLDWINYSLFTLIPKKESLERIKN